MTAATVVVALTRAVPESIARCELTHMSREPIDAARASAQHAQYEATLVRLGCTVRRVPAAPELPDSVFVEDTAIVLPELAIIARPGAASRRAETAAVADALHAYRRLAFIEAPGTLDGGDVLCIGRRIFVGASGRTNEHGVRQLRDIVAPFGYDTAAVRMSGCLHLKSAVTWVGDDVVLMNPAWLDTAAFARLLRIEVHPSEPRAANALRVGGGLVFPAAYPRTRERLEHGGHSVSDVEVDELEKAEAGVTCCSLLVPVPASATGQ